MLGLTKKSCEKSCEKSFSLASVKEYIYRSATQGKDFHLFQLDILFD